MLPLVIVSNKQVWEGVLLGLAQCSHCNSLSLVHRMNSFDYFIFFQVSLCWGVRFVKIDFSVLFSVIASFISLSNSVMWLSMVAEAGGGLQRPAFSHLTLSIVGVCTLVALSRRYCLIWILYDSFFMHSFSLGEAMGSTIQCLRPKLSKFYVSCSGWTPLQRLCTDKFLGFWSKMERILFVLLMLFIFSWLCDLKWSHGWVVECYCIVWDVLFSSSWSSSLIVSADWFNWGSEWVWG